MNTNLSEKHLIKLMPSFMLFLAILVLIGCGGGSSNSITTAGLVHTVSGQVSLPADFLYSSLRGAAEYTQILVYLEQYPAAATKCDESGKFIINAPANASEVNVIAQYGSELADSFFIQKSKAVKTGGQECDVGLIELEKGVCSFTLKLKDLYGSPMRGALCEIWGKKLYTDNNGLISSFLFPASIKETAISITPITAQSFTLTLPVGSADALADYELALDQKQPPLITLRQSAEIVNVNDIISITAHISDPSALLPSDYSVSWFVTDGTTLASSLHNETLSWTAPEKTGLVTVTAELSGSGFRTTTSLSIAVGGNHTINSKVTAFSPLTGAAGQTVTIKGLGFGAKQENCSADFGGTAGQILSWTETCIEAVVPRDAETARIKLTNGTKTFYTNETFTVIDYVITLSPDYGAPGASIKLTGYGFGDEQGSSSLLLDGTAIRNITKWNNTEIDFVVENSAFSGILSIVIRGRERRIAPFTVSKILKVSPAEATHLVLSDLPYSQTASTLTLTGCGFCSEGGSKPDNSFLYFSTLDSDKKLASISAEIVSWEAESIEAEIPRKAVSGPIGLVINGTAISGFEAVINPTTSYRNDMSWGAVLLETTPLITDVCRVNDKTILADNSNSLLWFVEDSDPDSNQLNVSLSSLTEEHRPYGMTTFINEDNEAFIYVTDIVSDSILKLSEDGSQVASTKISGAGLRGLCSDSIGRIYVADEKNHKIIVFDKDLKRITELGSNGVNDGELDEPVDVCVSADSAFLYVADSGNHRIQRFKINNVSNPSTLDFTFDKWFGVNNSKISGWHTGGYGCSSLDRGGFVQPSALACDSNYLFVADADTSIVQAISLADGSISTIGTKGSNDGQLNYPTGLCLEDSAVFIADSQNGRAQKIKYDGGFVAAYKPNVGGMSISFSDVAFYDDSVYVLDSDDSSVSVFNTNGVFKKKIGSEGSGNGQLNKPMGLDIDAKGNIWVADTENDRITTFMNDGTVKHFGQSGTIDGQLRKPLQIKAITDVNSELHIYVCDNYEKDSDRTGRVQVFSADGTHEVTFGKGIFNYPSGIAFNSFGEIFVADTNNHRVCKFDKNHNYIGWLGSSDGNNAGWHESVSGGIGGTSPGMFMQPVYLAVDFENSLFVSDLGNRNVQKFAPSGDKGGYLCEPASKDKFFGVCVDDGGCLFAITEDTVKLFVPDK